MPATFCKDARNFTSLAKSLKTQGKTSIYEKMQRCPQLSVKMPTTLQVLKSSVNTAATLPK